MVAHDSKGAVANDTLRIVGALAMKKASSDVFEVAMETQKVNEGHVMSCVKVAQKEHRRKDLEIRFQRSRCCLLLFWLPWSLGEHPLTSAHLYFHECSHNILEKEQSAPSRRRMTGEP